MNKKFISEIDDTLTPQNMLRLYSIGAFPMADENTGDIGWFMPEIRAIIPLDSFNVPRGLKKIINKNDFEIKYDFDFLSIIKNCANRDKTWISEKLINAYLKLNKLGSIHTVEIYKDGYLVGGLYGVQYLGAFFGESMFSKISQASKIALIKLIERLKVNNFVLLDVQYMTEHLKMFGAKEISYSDYSYLLQLAYQKDCIF